MGPKSAANLAAAIAASKHPPLERLIHALGIRHVGKTTARALARAFGTLDELAAASADDLLGVPDVGPVVAESVERWFRSKAGRGLLAKLHAAGVRPVAAEAPVAGPGAPWAGLTFVLTGTLAKRTRLVAGREIEALGGTVSGSVSRKTHVVVAGEEAGSKLDTAKKLGVPVLDEAAFDAALAEPALFAEELAAARGGA
jgi:DNA ligase (NAD+)